MADTQMKEAAVKQESLSQQQAVRPSGEALEKLGGFMAVKGFIPAAADMNPSKAATRKIFLTDKKYKAKREALAQELRGWLEILSADKSNSVEYADVCKEMEEKYQKLLEKNVTTALEATEKLEKTYRSLDLFFKNANEEKLYNLRLVNVNSAEFEDESSTLSQQINDLLRDGFDRLSLKESYSLLVIPGYKMQDKATLLKWAKIANKYKVMLVTDHDQEHDFDSLLENTSDYKDSDAVLQNVIMTGNWIVGRQKENLSLLERESDEKAFFIPSSAALAGMLYDETANMAQGAAGKKHGTLADVKGVEVDLLKTQIASLMDNQIVPMVYSEGRVMAFNNSTLYNGDNKAMTEYPIVRVFDWVKKVLMNFVHDVALENWDPYETPVKLQNKISAFLNEQQKKLNLFKDFKVELPIQDPTTKKISLNVTLEPYYAAKNFTIKLSADKDEKTCEDI
jgi:hypothetical protein